VLSLKVELVAAHHARDGWATVVRDGRLRAGSGHAPCLSAARRPRVAAARCAPAARRPDRRRERRTS
jgi:hypothetical protein